MSNRAVCVWPEEPLVSGDTCTVAATVEGLPRCPQRLWYSVTAEHQAALTKSADPFVIALVFPAMSNGSPLRVHGTASPSLLKGLEEFQAAWSCWRADHYCPIDVDVDHESEQSPATSDAAIMGFSGGLDSCFTAWRHRRGLAGRRCLDLQAALMVHGFDIPLQQQGVFQRASENSHHLVGSIGVPLIPAATNVREFGGGNWEMTHGAALAACLHLLKARYSYGLIAATHTFSTLRLPWGSNPLTDRLLGTAEFSIVHDGTEFSRLEKARAVQAWPEAMRRLRVCWQGDQLDRNCGRCVRCVATAIAFVVAGAEVPPSLAITSLDEAVHGLRKQPLNPIVRTRLAELLAAARNEGLRATWVDELAACVRMRRRLTVRKVVRRIGRMANQIGRLFPTRVM